MSDDDKAVVLQHRGLLYAKGDDLHAFLQGVISNDIEKVSPDRAIWAALLTPQGKFLHEFMIAELDGGFLIDGEAERLADLLKRLKLYRLRAKVTIEDRQEDFVVVGAFGPGALDRLGLSEVPGTAVSFAGGVAFTDPRGSALGARILLPRARLADLEAAGFVDGKLSDYDALRVALGIPDGSRDMAVEGTILLENGFEELGGVDFQKGCFIGQEVTARTKYRGLLKKRLMPVAFDGAAPTPATPVMQAEREVGQVYSVAGDHALVLLRLKALQGGPLTAGSATLTPSPPDWLRSGIEAEA